MISFDFFWVRAGNFHDSIYSKYDYIVWISMQFEKKHYFQIYMQVHCGKYSMHACMRMSICTASWIPPDSWQLGKLLLLHLWRHLYKTCSISSEISEASLHASKVVQCIHRVKQLTLYELVTRYASFQG